MPMTESKVQSHTTTGLPPCCLRIFRDQYILIGTYELHKPTGVRTGSLDVYDDELNLIKSYPTYGAILDLKISPFDDTLVITAHSTGNIMIWKVDNENSNTIQLEMIANIQLFDTHVLIASLHFSPLDAKLISVTNTMGESAIVNIEAGGEIESVTSQVIADSYSRIDQKLYEVQGKEVNAVDGVVQVFDEPHALECWTAEFGQLSPFENVLFTGGDDATIMAHDIREKNMIWSNNRIHDAGVVGIKCSSQNFRSNKPTSIITGSYDDHIRSLELRMMGDMIYPGSNVPVATMSDLNLGGGVWRFTELPLALKQENAKEDTLMVCCMYDGAKVVTMNDESVEMGYDYFQVEHFLKSGHESMCYGGDWCSKFVATCSFYDKSLQTWNP